MEACELTATTNFVPAAFAFRVGIDLSFLGGKYVRLAMFLKSDNCSNLR